MWLLHCEYNCVDLNLNWISWCLQELRNVKLWSLTAGEKDRRLSCWFDWVICHASITYEQSWRMDTDCLSLLSDHFLLKLNSGAISEYETTFAMFIVFVLLLSGRTSLAQSAEGVWFWLGNHGLTYNRNKFELWGLLWELKGSYYIPKFPYQVNQKVGLLSEDRIVKNLQIWLYE